MERQREREAAATDGKDGRKNSRGLMRLAREIAPSDLRDLVVGAGFESLCMPAEMVLVYGSGFGAILDAAAPGGDEL